MIHFVKSYNWDDGELTVYQNKFDTLEEALCFSKIIYDQIIKIYNDKNELVFQRRE